MTESSTTRPSNHNILHIPPREEFHRTFGGMIYNNDYDINHKYNNTKSGSIITQRIVSDMKFDKECRQNAEKRDRKKEVKNYERK